jgi:hypothetical protein
VACPVPPSLHYLCPAFPLPALRRDRFKADYVVVLSMDSSELAAFGANVEELWSLGCQVPPFSSPSGNDYSHFKSPPLPWWLVILL